VEPIFELGDRDRLRKHEHSERDLEPGPLEGLGACGQGDMTEGLCTSTNPLRVLEGADEVVPVSAIHGQGLAPARLDPLCANIAGRLPHHGDKTGDTRSRELWFLG